jgi:2-polyprenyl-3-methyl-5-hydroxy-6-metoxy-1,4-benzoquinol methylase
MTGNDPIRGIAEGIHAAHDRVANQYGTVPVSGSLEPNSYGAWNFQSNVVHPIRQIIETYYTGGIFLDAGCGNGQISQVLAAHGVERILGVDFSQRMLAAAVQRAESSGYRKQFMPARANLDDLELFPTGSFSMALLFGVIEHLDHPGQVLSNLVRVIKPGGYLILGVPRRFSLSYFSYLATGQSPSRWGGEHRFVDRFRYVEKLRYYRFYSPAQIRCLLHRFGTCSIEKIIPFARLHLDGFPGKILHLLGKWYPAGHRILTGIEKTLTMIRLIPAGEFWVIRVEDD